MVSIPPTGNIFASIYAGPSILSLWDIVEPSMPSSHESSKMYPSPTLLAKSRFYGMYSGPKYVSSNRASIKRIIPQSVLKSRFDEIYSPPMCLPIAFQLNVRFYYTCLSSMCVRVVLLSFHLVRKVRRPPCVNPLGSSKHRLLRGLSVAHPSAPFSQSPGGFSRHGLPRKFTR